MFLNYGPFHRQDFIYIYIYIYIYIKLQFYACNLPYNSKKISVLDTQCVLPAYVPYNMMDVVMVRK